MCAIKKGADFEGIARLFLERILEELNYTVVRSRTQNSGTQDGYDNMVVVVDNNYCHRQIYVECKDYSTQLNHTAAIEKIAHILSTHGNIDLLLFMSPYRDFSNPNEESKLDGFYKALSPVCPVEFLTPSSFIQEYFSLYPDLYKVLYALEIEPLSTENRKYLLDKFEKLLFSDKNLKKVIVQEAGKSLYIGTLQKDPYHIPRTIRSQSEENPYGWEEKEPENLLKSILLHSGWGLVLLGNPGYGKTSELKHLAFSLWEERVLHSRVPKYEKLKDFHSVMNIESLLPPDYKHIGRIVVILDGIDEIYDIADFSNKLRRFCTEQRQFLDAGEIKFVISCRTNIYLKYIKSIEGLEPYFLNGVSEGGAVRFLHQKFKIDLRIRKDFDFWRFRDIVRNPFYLEMIGKTLTLKPGLPISRPKLIEAYIERRLEEDFQGKNRNDPKFNPNAQLKTARELAIAMEVMQRTELKGNEVIEILKDGRDCSKNPFLEQSPSGSWSFEHKNIQEYLTASSLCLLPFERIIELISLGDDFPKVHPSWHNVINFLLNMDFDQTTYSNLVGWLVQHDLELVFFADPGSVPEAVKNNALQTVFQHNCVEQSLWLSNVGQMAVLGNTNQNVAYLLDQLENPSIHIRARISASTLLKEMSLLDQYGQRLETIGKQVIHEFLLEPEVYLILMETVLELVLGTAGEHQSNFLTFAIKELTDHDQREIVGPILKGINKQNLEQHLGYVLEILSKAIKEKQWKKTSRYGSVISTKEKIYDIFCTITNPQLLLKIFHYTVERNKYHELREKQVRDFYAHITVEFASNIEQIREELIAVINDAVIGDKIRHFEDDLLIDLVKSCGLVKLVFEQLLDKSTQYSHTVHFIAALLNTDLIDRVVALYNSGNLQDSYLLALRNLSSCEDLELTVLLQSRIECNTPYRFEKLFSKEKIESDAAFNRSRDQVNFDIKFNKAELIINMEKIFDHLNVSELSYEMIGKFSEAYYHRSNLQKSINYYAHSLLRQIIYANYEAGLKKVELVVALDGYELDRIEDIFLDLPKEEKNRIVVSDEQRYILENWSVQKQDIALKFFKEGKDDEKETCRRITRLVSGFQKYFKFESLSQKLLLEMIWGFEDEGKLNLDYMDGLVETDVIKAHIVSLLESEKLEIVKLYLLHQYALDAGLGISKNNARLKQTIIEELTIGDSYYPRKLIVLFYNEEVLFLKSLLNGFGMDKRHSYFIQFLLDRLIELGEASFVEDFLSENHDELRTAEILEEKMIISTLIKSNSKLAFELVHQRMLEGTVGGSPLISGYSKSWDSFTNKDAIFILLDIIAIHISGSYSRSVFDYTVSATRVATETLISIAKACGESTCLLIWNKFTERCFVVNDDDVIFYLNGFKRDLANVIAMHRSKPYKLGQAIALLERHKYDLI